MPPLPVMGWRNVVKTLQNLGRESSRQSGSHIALVKDEQAATLSIPKHKEIRKGTLRGLIRAAGLTIDEFLAAI